MSIAQTLFSKLQPQYREVQWYPDGFFTEDPPTRTPSGVYEKESLLLVPGFFGHPGPIPRESGGSKVWWADHGHNRQDDRTRFNFRDAKLDFSVNVSSHSARSLDRQIERALAKALNDGPLKGRRFFMDPVIQHWRKDRWIITAVFSVEGDPIPGLVLGEATTTDWRSFIPPGPDRELIASAIESESGQRSRVLEQQSATVLLIGNFAG